LKDARGISLVELMIAVALSGMLTLILYEMLSSQNRVYSMEDDAAEMQQNLRVATERISRDLRMAGFGRPPWSVINEDDLSSWYNGANGYRAYNVAGDEASTLHILGCIDGTVHSLGAKASSGAGTVTLTGSGSSFNATNKRDISIGNLENAKVQSVSGSTLTIDTDPVAAGNQGLRFDHDPGTALCVVKWVTYSRDAANQLLVNEHQGAGNQAIAQHITGLVFSAAGTVITFSLTGRTRKPDRTTGRHITLQVTGKVTVRN
jgi:Tfp pilus assembly protein PilE